MKSLATPLRIAVAVMAVVVLAAGCAGGSPRFTDRPETTESAEPVAQTADLAGELLIALPERGAEQLLKENPDRVLTLTGMRDIAPPVTPVILPPAPDTAAVRTRPVLPTGPRKEYQIQVAITPSLMEAEELQERLAPLLPQEEVFIFFTRPYYRIRVGHKPTRPEADALLAKLYQLGYTKAMVIPVTVLPPG